MSYVTIECTKNYLKHFWCPKCHSRKVFISMEDQQPLLYMDLELGKEYICDNCFKAFRLIEKNYDNPKHAKQKKLGRKI